MRWSSPVDRHDVGSLAQVFLREPDDDGSLAQVFLREPDDNRII